MNYSPNCKRSQTKLSVAALDELPAFLRLAIPSTVMICLEYWTFEGLVLLSGLLANPQLETSALSICITTLALLAMIPYSIGAAVSTRAGNELGAGRPEAARGAVAMAVSLALLEGLHTATLLVSLRFVWARAFTDEREVVDYVAECTPLIAVVHVMDAIQGVLSGVARGCGWQTVGAAASLGAFYVVGLPTAVVLAFEYAFNGRGLWFGMIVGIVTQSITLLVMTGTTDWHQQAEGALLRVYSSATATLPMDGNYSRTDGSIPALHWRKDCVDDAEFFHR